MLLLSRHRIKFISLMLVVACLLQGVPVASPHLLTRQARASPPRQETPADADATATIYLPSIQGGMANRAPNFVINSPTTKKLSGTVFFSVQPVNASQIVSVTFAAGDSSVTDSNGSNGFAVILNAKSFPAGPRTLSATAFGPGGQSTQTLDVEFVPQPPTSTVIDADGAVVGSEIGSTLAIPPGGAPAGTTIAVDELTQAEVTTETNIRWDQLGVTFLGAQKISVSNPFTSAFGVSSAGFGNRVQPGQVVVTYMLLPDADGDGVGELSVINGAATAPNGDVISSPIDRATVSAPTGPITGAPGALVRLAATGFNAASYLGSMGVWRSDVNGETLRVPALIELSEANPTGQVLALVIPPLPAGGASVTFFNESNGSSAGPFAVTILPSAALPTSAADVIDRYLLESAAYFKAIPSNDPTAKDALIAKADNLLSVRKALAESIAAGLSAPQQAALERAAQVIAGSLIYRASGQIGYVAGTSDEDMGAFLFGFSTILNTLFEPLAANVAASSPDAPQLFPAVAVILLGGIIAALEAARVAKALKQLRECRAAQRQNINNNRMTGMGSAPPRGGPTCGTVNGPGPFPNPGRQSSANAQPIVVRVYSRNGRQLSPFTGVVDASGYFYVPLVPQNQPYVIVALDPNTGYLRKYGGVGPVQTSFNYFHFDLTQDPFTAGVIRWDGAGDGESWDDPMNWDRGILPGPDHHVIIDAPGQITVTHFFTQTHIKSLSSQEPLVVAGGELWIKESTVISKELVLSGGQLGITGTLTVSGSLAWAGGTLSGPGKTILINETPVRGGFLKGHTLENRGTLRWLSGPIYLSEDAVLHNTSVAIFSDEQIDNGSIAYYSNADSSRFRNDGQYVKSGDSTSYIQVPFHNNGTSVDVQRGILQLSDGVLAGNSTLKGELGSSVLTIPGGSGATMQGPMTWSGSLTGTGTLTTTGVITWASTTLQGGGKAIVSGDLRIETLYLFGRTLENRGTLRWVGGPVYLGEDALLHNTASGIFSDEQIDNGSIAYYSNADSSRFRNDGQYVKSGDSTSYIQVPFHNNGTSVEVQRGILQLSDGVLAGNSTLKGEFGGSVLTIPGGSGATMQGPMTWSGSLTGTGTLTTTGVVTWANTTLQGGGKAIVSGDLRIETLYLFGRTLENRGTLRWGGGPVYLSEDALLHNTASGIFRDEQIGNGSIAYYSNADSSRFRNDGQYVKSGDSTSYIQVPFHNNGTSVDVQRGILQLSDGVLAGNSTLKGEFGSSVLTIPGGNGATMQGPMTWSGSLTGTGTLTTTGVITWANTTFQGGGKVVVSGDLRIETLYLFGHTLENRGTLRWVGGLVYLTNDALLHNTASGTFRDDQVGNGGIAYYSNADSSHFRNDGEYVKSGDSTSYISVPLHNNGTTTVSVNILALTDGSNGGILSIAGGATADINGLYENKAGGTITGSGTLDVSNATFTNNGTIEGGVTVIN